MASFSWATYPDTLIISIRSLSGSGMVSVTLAVHINRTCNEARGWGGSVSAQTYWSVLLPSTDPQEHPGSGRESWHSVRGPGAPAGQRRGHPGNHGWSYPPGENRKEKPQEGQQVQNQVEVRLSATGCRSVSRVRLKLDSVSGATHIKKDDPSSGQKDKVTLSTSCLTVSLFTHGDSHWPRVKTKGELHWFSNTISKRLKEALRHLLLLVQYSVSTSTKYSNASICTRTG